MDDTRPPATAAPHHSAPVFIAHDGAGARLWIAADLDARVRTLELDVRARFDRVADALVAQPRRAAGRASTTVLEAAGLRIHVKRALKGGVLAPLYLGRVPAWRRVGRELHTAAGLHARGAPVPRPVFAAGRFGPLGWRALIGSELVAGALDGATALARARGSGGGGGESEAEPRRALDAVETIATFDRFDVHDVFRSFGRGVRALHDAGGWHADLAVTNLLFVPDTARGWVVDFQGGGVGEPPPARRRARELARLRRSIERRPEIAPALAEGWTTFLAAYEEAPEEGRSDAPSGGAPPPAGRATVSAAGRTRAST